MNQVSKVEAKQESERNSKNERSRTETSKQLTNASS